MFGDRRQTRHRHAWLLCVWSFDFGFACEPALAESVYDPREIFAEHLSKLALDLALDILLDNGDGVEGAADIHILERVCFEDEGDAFLF